MSAKLKYTIVILAAVFAAFGVEVWYAADGSDVTPTLTELIRAHIPWEVTRAVIVGGAVWLWLHFRPPGERDSR